MQELQEKSTESCDVLICYEACAYSTDFFELYNKQKRRQLI